MIIISCDYIDFDDIGIDVLWKKDVRISIQASETESGGRWPRTEVAEFPRCVRNWNGGFA